MEYLKDAVGMVQGDGYFTKTHFLEILKNKESLEDILNEGKANK